jgi:hypothetical protein
MLKISNKVIRRMKVEGQEYVEDEPEEGTEGRCS